MAPRPLSHGFWTVLTFVLIALGGVFVYSAVSESILPLGITGGLALLAGLYLLTSKFRIALKDWLYRFAGKR